MTMTKGEFAALLGLRSNSAEGIDIESAIVLMRSALSDLMPSQQGTDSDIRGTTLLEWGGSSVLLQDLAGKLYRIGSIGDEGLLISQDCGMAFDLLFDKDALDKIFDVDAVAELQRLHAAYVAEARDRGRNRERAELKRLKAKYEGVNDD